MSEYGDPAVARAFWRSVPPPLRTILKTGIWLYLLGLILDIGQMIVAILSYTGAVTETDPDVDITFPSVGDHVQRLIIAWASLGVVVHITLAAMVTIRIGRRAITRNEKHYTKARLVLLTWYMPWSLASLVVWSVCVGLQTRNYVPNLNALPECKEYSGLTQCGMVFGSWIIGMVYMLVLEFTYAV